MESRPPSEQPSHNWFQWYHVAEGDTLSDIAKWRYGSGAEMYRRRIWLASRRTIGEDPNQIRPSQ